MDSDLGGRSSVRKASANSCADRQLCIASARRITARETNETESIALYDDCEDRERFVVVSVPLGPVEHLDDITPRDLKFARRPAPGRTALPELDAEPWRPDLPSLVARVDRPRVQLRHAHIVARIPIGRDRVASALRNSLSGCVYGWCRV
jgi:hypothetical protein